MADFVKRPTIYKRVQYTGDNAAFLAELQAETNSWWQWWIFEGADSIALHYNSNGNQQGFLEVRTGWYVIFRDGPEELPVIDYDGTSVIPAP